MTCGEKNTTKLDIHFQPLDAWGVWSHIWLSLFLSCLCLQLPIWIMTALELWFVSLLLTWVLTFFCSSHLILTIFKFVLKQSQNLQKSGQSIPGQSHPMQLSCKAEHGWISCHQPLSWMQDLSSHYIEPKSMGKPFRKKKNKKPKTSKHNRPASTKVK